VGSGEASPQTAVKPGARRSFLVARPRPPRGSAKTKKRPRGANREAGAEDASTEQPVRPPGGRSLVADDLEPVHRDTPPGGQAELVLGPAFADGMPGGDALQLRHDLKQLLNQHLGHPLN
jgi:hypothetical protein